MVLRKSIIIVFSTLLFLLPILKYHALNSSIFDLGVFTNISYAFDSTINFNKIFSGHIHLYAVFTSLLDKIFQSPYILLELQSIVVLSSIYYIAKLSKERYSELIIIVFLLSYAVWYNVLFDFHYDHISILLMLMFYYFVKEQKYKTALFVSVLVSLIKEPFALVTSFMGLYMIIKSKQYLKGSLLIIYGFVYFYIATHYLIPFFTPEYAQVGSIEFASFGNGGSLIDIALFPITHFPEFILGIITTKKIVYLIALFSAFGLIVMFFSIRELIPAIPSLGIALLSNIENYYWYNTHYTAPLIAPFIVAFIYGLPRLIFFCKNKVKFFYNEKMLIIVIFIPIILSHIIFSPSPVSRFFWINKLPQYHYSAYTSTKRTEMIKKAIINYVPKNRNIVVSSQNSLNWGYLARRDYYYSFPQGALEEIKIEYIDSDSLIGILDSFFENENGIVKTKKIRADFVVIDMKRPLYFIDKYIEKEQFLKVVEQIKEDYSIVYEKDGFLIMKLNRTLVKKEIKIALHSVSALPD